MAENLEPLIWKISEKTDKDDVWPKKNYGAYLLYLYNENKYVLIGGNHDAYQNELTYFQLNKELISSVDATPMAYQKATNNKINYIGQNLSDNYYNKNQIDIYIYELEPEPHWSKRTASGTVPRARSGHQCISIDKYIFLFGGVQLGPKSENLSTDELFVLNTKTFQWKKIITNDSPTQRTDFKWVKLNNTAFLYGGCSSPSENFYDDLWMFQFDRNSDGLYMDLFNPEDLRKDVTVENIWSKIEPTNNNVSPGKVKAYSMEYYHQYLYLFGGSDPKGISNNNMYRFDLDNLQWELVETKGYAPCPRSYHNMAKINTETFALFGGIIGTLRDTKEFLNDVYLYNVRDSVWVVPQIGGITPAPRIGCAFTSNYHADCMSIMILGGYIINDNSDKKNYVKIFNLTENDKNSNYFWTIRNINFKEQENDDNFLLQTEKNIYEYKEKISNLELDTQNKENANEEMKKQINEHKKQFFQTHGFIEDQSQTLEEQINEQENQKNKIKENYEMDQQITDLKRKLRYVMEKKNEKTMEFFNETCGVFINYYDAVNKIITADENLELSEIFTHKHLEEIKDKYCKKLQELKSKLEKCNSVEEGLETELHRYSNDLEKPLTEAFKNEMKKYNIQEE